MAMTRTVAGFALLLASWPASAPGGEGKAFGPPAGAKWVAIPELTDEFDGGKLDAGKWHDHNPTWKGRQPALFAQHNVTVADGELRLTMRKEDVKDRPAGYHTFTSAAVQSQALVRYGYFEVRCRPMDSRGSSSFWFYHGTPEVWTEIDVFEMGAGAPKHERLLHTNVHVFHTLVNPDRHWSRSKALPTPFRLADGFHVYALEWNPAKLRFHLDGECVRETENTHWHQPLTLNFDSETMPNWFGLPDPNDLPSTFRIDYVRSWRQADGYGDQPYPTCEITFDAKEAAAAKGRTKTYRLKAADEGGGELLLVAKHSGSPRPSLTYFEYRDDAFFAAGSGPRLRREVRVAGESGEVLRLVLDFEKVKGHPANHGYRADDVSFPPAGGPKPGEQRRYSLTAADGTRIAIRLTY